MKKINSKDFNNPIVCKKIFFKSKKDILVAYNFSNPNGFLITDKKCKRILKMCNGLNDVNQISNKLKIKNDILVKLLEKFENKRIILYNQNKKKINDKTIHCWLHVSNSCNLNCRYCYIEKTNKIMEYSMAKNIINRIVIAAKKNNIKKILITFSGGEPLLNFSIIKKIIKYCNSNNEILFNYRILTNGTIINSEIINTIKKNNIDIRISLDGMKKYNDKNRVFNSGIGSYDVVIKQIILLKNANIVPTINVVLNNENINDLPKFTGELINLKLPFHFSLERCNNKTTPSLVYNQKKLIKQVKKSLIIINEKKYRKFQFENIKLNSQGRTCEAGITTFAVDTDGKVAICGMDLNTPVFDIKKSADILDDLKKTKIAKYNVINSKKCKKCKWVKICNNGCPVFNYKLHNNYEQKNEYCIFYKKIIPLIFKEKLKDALSNHLKVR